MYFGLSIYLYKFYYYFLVLDITYIDYTQLYTIILTSVGPGLGCGHRQV